MTIWNELSNAMRSLILRGVVEAVDDTGPEQCVDVQLHYGQQRSRVPVLQPFGLSSFAPLDGAIVHVLQTGNDPSDSVAFPPANPSAARMGGLSEGETVVYDSAGQRLYFSAGQLIRVDAAKEMTVAIAGQTVLDVTTSGVAITGSLTVTGPINAQGDVTAGTVSLQNHVHGGVQSGGAKTSAPQ
ncbi:phage baseplate assembly protein V [Neokomagataea anthophila]|uniref:Phage baseplate assembly protein n=1 Tax=Neokomagataea anthophila TaxID=2826925 RepID=A0ABS5E6F8_9PROT|nr:phage baseplate assembly protein V [Neokomagataea anthophila]MBR0559492.1 phage baseplate assembly protein [Neokomagataea anthophila]